MKRHANRESGAALIVAMLLMLVFTIMLIGFYFMTSGEQKVAWSSRDNGVTYYWAVAGLEQMSSLIADYFSHTATPVPSTLTNWVSASSNFQTYPTSISTSGLPLVTSTYTLYCAPPPSPTGQQCDVNLMTLSLCSGVSSLGYCTGTIGGNGPLAGLAGLVAPFKLVVVADGPSNTEVKLARTVQEIAVPIFEFGIFSDSDLSFHSGTNFSFGGRVHTNGNLYLAEDGNSTLLLDDYVSAAKGIIRTQLSNGYQIQSGGAYSYTVDVLTGANGCPPPPPVPTGDACRALALTEGSLTGGPGSSENSNWKTLSLSTYGGYIQDGTTGAKVLNLAIALPGINSQPISMIQRPTFTESPTSALGMARFFNQASLRILLSDTQSDIMNIQGIDATEQPYPLAELGSTGAAYTITRPATNPPPAVPSTYCPASGNCFLPPGDNCHPPLAESVGSATDPDYMTAAGTTLLGGYIKIEMNLQSSPGTWKDVTEEILAQGISRDEGPGAVMSQASPTLQSNGSLSSNTKYYYIVTAVNAYGESAGTQTTGTTTTSSNKTIKLTWSSIPGASSYNVYRTTTSATYTGSGAGYIGSSGGTSYTDNGSTSPSGNGPPSPSCTNKSILHLEEAAPGVNLTASPLAPLTPTNFVPINMYDAREGELRDSIANNTSTSSLNGIMNIVEVDVGNLQQWFAGTIASSGQYAYNGPDALDNSGYILYTSDRRMNCMDGKYDLEGTCASNTWSTTGISTAGESAEFGNEDIVNPGNSNGAPNQTLDTGENVDGSVDGSGNPVLDTYGVYAHPIATASTTVSPTGTNQSGTWSQIIQSLSNSATTHPAFVRLTPTQAEKNSVVLFRRALRLVNGTAGNLPPFSAAQASTCSGGTTGGFTVVSENPIYVQGDYNASAANGFTDVSGQCHVPASVMGDAVTLLSNNWTPGAQSGNSSGDANSFLYPTYPNCNNQRCATTTYYRMAVMSGKTIPFAQPSWGQNDTGTDGGVHNFLRYVEDWSNTNVSLNYLGSLASFYYSRQATGIYKYNFNNVVYQPPTRNYSFDTDFQNINKLPPGVPRFTDVNALSYYQSILPTQ
jgi:hypothetical protein